MTAERTRFVRRFGEIGILDRASAGGKGASLGELKRAGIRVPPGCVVTTGAFEEFLAEMDPDACIRKSMENLSSGDLAACSKAAQEASARFDRASFPLDLREEIESHYNELCDARCGGEPSQAVAVRSSATSEDSASASFAGLQDTYLWVRGAASVVEHVRKCWSSLYTVESVTYRRRLGLPERGLEMGVVIQRMIDPRCSGVMFTRSPATGDRSVVVVEASWGLGSAVVSGEVTPDKYVVGKITREIVSKNISRKMRLHRPNADGAGVIAEEVSPDLQSAVCLRDAELEELVAIAKRIEDHYGCPQDIEWALAKNLPAGENIYILQSRPETAWAGNDAGPVAAPKSKPFDHVFSLLGGGAAKK
ncbi:MAG TPA: PEP/pyruvate-binding domain-containing protein [Candidatus Acidoferrum sp.]|nr:PEP/pyruvate-binding domain-containing protein [Candidatus Acidoferrum sp.]